MTDRPLQEPSFLILTALASGPKHGYAVLRGVEELSNGRVSLRPGTLYTALDRLCGEHLVESDRVEVVDGRFYEWAYQARQLDEFC